MTTIRELPDATRGGTKARIIETATRLFSEHGFDAVSMRDIAVDANVNGAAVNYHFGSKEQLIRAIYHQLFVGLNELRIQALDRCEASIKGGRPTPEQIVRAWIDSTVTFSSDVRGSGVYLVRLLFHAYGTSRDIIDQSIAEQIDHITVRFVDALHKALPKASREDLFWRFDFAIGACLHILIDPRRGYRLRRISSGLCDTANYERVIDQLVASIVASLVAPKLSGSAPESTINTSAPSKRGDNRKQTPLDREKPRSLLKVTGLKRGR
jgi:AcrR family transcriptional regulator